MLIGMLIMATLSASVSAAPPQKKKKQPHLVEVVTAEYSTANTVNKWHGSLEYSKLVKIYNQEKGRIDSFPFREGDRVEKNATLVHLDDRLLRAEKSKLLAQIAQAKTDRNRIQTLVKKRALSAGELDQAKTQLAIYNAEKNLLDIRLSYFSIGAPFAGIITERFANKGDAVPAEQHLLTLSDHRSLVAKVQVSEKALDSITMGMPATVIIPISGARISGQISRIYPKLHPTTRQATVEIKFDEPPENLFSGQSVIAELNNAKKERILIPLAALKRDGEGEHVFLLKTDGKAYRQPVTSSNYIAGKVEITEGLQQGDEIITRGFLGLNNGKKVSISGSIKTEETADKQKSKLTATQAKEQKSSVAQSINSTLNDYWQKIQAAFQ